MIDSEFIIQYTNALYSTPAEYAPRYDEFRDMFSSGQIRSKEWLVKELINLSSYGHLQNSSSFAIAGAWYGTLGVIIKSKFSDAIVNMIDIDPRCEKFVHNIIYDIPAVKYHTKDMYDYRYTEDVIINTSCEHIPDLREWLDIVPINKIVVLQSNNFSEGAGHINCVTSEEDFIKKSGLNKILYSGELQMPMYTRYMIIGET